MSSNLDIVNVETINISVRVFLTFNHLTRNIIYFANTFIATYMSTVTKQLQNLTFYNF